MSRLDPRNCLRQLSYAIKNQLPLGCISCPSPVLYGMRELAEQDYDPLDEMRAEPRHSSTNDSGEPCFDGSDLVLGEE